MTDCFHTTKLGAASCCLHTVLVLPPIKAHALQPSSLQLLGLAAAACRPAPLACKVGGFLLLGHMAQNRWHLRPDGAWLLLVLQPQAAGKLL